MNRYPLWKYLLIVAVAVVGLLYALPNLFPEDPSLQISPATHQALTTADQERVLAVIKEKSLNYKSSSFNPEMIMVRFNDTETQLAAFDYVKSSLGSSYVVALNLAPATPGWLRSINAKPMYLGLDLRGGVHFLLEVDMKAAVDKALERSRTDFRNELMGEKIRSRGIRRDGDSITLKFTTAEERQRAMDVLKNAFRNEFQFDEETRDDSAYIIAKLKKKHLIELKKFALKQNITALRKRVNELGVAEPIIQQQGLERIVVQLPGVQDTARAKKILGATATLEFRMVDEQGDPYAAQASGRIPPKDKLFKERNGNPILLKRRVMLTGEYITGAASGIDSQTGTPSVNITLDGKGARMFSKATGANIKKLMAVVFIETKPDGSKVEEVINVARIQDQLSRRFQITGLDNPREARDLALLLRAGALAAPMYFIEERTVGPSLGKANIEKGFMSVAIGFVLVMLFMAAYYRLFGLVANVALAMNLVLIVAVLSMLQATLTLPGIAGIVLTVGMAVDANVLIFERIREELRLGNSPQNSIAAGYEQAFSTILDANITTLIAALVLFTFGTGPIKGFAVTLSIGIASSMFTAIVVTRGIINLIYGRKARLESLSIGGV
ncbi:MAG TPA: protein translocase subunit SecD [Gammaproteobacteria bacterium]|nr:protein translocase subunit SecD [Gammaproteobacteria bacterium]